MVTNDLWHYFFASTAKHEYYFRRTNPLVKHTAPLSMGTGTLKYVG